MPGPSASRRARQMGFILSFHADATSLKLSLTIRVTITSAGAIARPRLLMRPSASLDIADSRHTSRARASIFC